MKPLSILPLLQGKWESDTSDLSFAIAGTDIINIEGSNLVASELKLQWNDNLTTWQINIPFLRRMMLTSRV